MTEHGSRPARHRPPGRDRSGIGGIGRRAGRVVPPGRRRAWIGVAVAALAASGLAACGTANAGTRPVTLNYYLYPDSSGATQTAIKNCDAQSGGKYTISYQQLPQAADGQRQQLVRRLAAHDDTIDIMGLDVTWESEFAQAGWAEPWTGTDKAQAENGTLKPALDTAIWKGKLYAVPDNSNTQLLWYRSDLVKKPPTTWAEMISDAEQLAKEGKPHYIEIQGAQYEGATVWFNTMVASAGGTVLNPDATKVTLGGPTVKALSIMKQLATSPAADPSLDVQMENQNRLAMEAGTAAFELNYPFVYPAMKADNPKLFKSFKWALYPEVNPGQPAKVTIGGIDLAVSSYSLHKALAFQAALCLRDKQNQIIGANVGGVPPTITSLYNNPKLFADYPFHADILKALEEASVRPKSPVYQVVSIDISHLVAPAKGINPAATEQSMVSQLSNALQSKGLVP
ncbi:MAG TPA: ABC transporter substrate-binding protein [Streptosporangiaceae bacterium]|nr:ABC transporter substrate-binding protein [Streptosporangiaceae bacterium]